MDYLNHLMIVYGAYIVATASPGPSNMAIMAVAMNRGRRAGLAIAAGIVTGSLLWAAIAATGLSSLLATYSDALFVIKIAGGLYLLYLAWKAARSEASDRTVWYRAAGSGAIALSSIARRRLSQSARSASDSRVLVPRRFCCQKTSGSREAPSSGGRPSKQWNRLAPMQ